MPVDIDGELYKLKEITGTDLKAVMDFCNTNKVKGALMIYIDKDDEIEVTGYYKNQSAKKLLDNISVNGKF